MTSRAPSSPPPASPALAAAKDGAAGLAATGGGTTGGGTTGNAGTGNAGTGNAGTGNTGAGGKGADRRDEARRPAAAASGGQQRAQAAPGGRGTGGRTSGAPGTDGDAASGAHRFALRVYYEDTDLAGIVYYANYLKFIERARSEWVRGIGIDQRALRADAGLVFAVRRLEADYLRPAYFDDALLVETHLVNATGARIALQQHVLRDGLRLFDARVTLACLDIGGRPRPLPAKIRQALAPGPG